MVVNGTSLLRLAPIKDMIDTKIKDNGVSYGLSEAGYDIRIDQEIRFYPQGSIDNRGVITVNDDWEHRKYGKFVIASAMEEFEMPSTLVGVVHDKSSWARLGLSVFNTVIEPGWKGFLTLELVYHGSSGLTIPRGAGIAQVLFHKVSEPRQYNGKYQDQPRVPVEAIFEK